MDRTDDGTHCERACLLPAAPLCALHPTAEPNVGSKFEPLHALLKTNIKPPGNIRTPTRYTMERVESGYQLTRPADCPEDVYAGVMLPCLAFDPKERITFAEVVDIWAQMNVSVYSTSRLEPMQPRLHAHSFPSPGAGSVVHVTIVHK
jgi:hypothetical protein